MIAYCAFAFVAALLSCEAVRRFAMRRALLDKPNERSLHQTPTPRLGGVAIICGVVLGAAPLVLGAGLEVRVLLGGGLLIAVLGLVDDIKPLRASLRFVLQIAGAALLLWAIGLPKLDVLPGVALNAPAWVVAIVLTIWIGGVLNIYNFMDGMDGLAGTQAVVTSAAHAVIFDRAGQSDLSSVAAILGASSSGFLAQNFPPARIFMGDAGSTFVGFVFAGLGVIGMHHGVSLLALALPLSPFLLDGTFTILRRASRKEAVWRAHRTHLYQRAVQTGLAHREVLLVYAGWMAIVLGVSAFGGSAALVYGGWAVSVLVLLGVWRWVVGRETGAV